MGLVLFRKFPLTIATGAVSEIVVVFVRLKGEPGNSAKVPSPFPLNSDTELSPWLTMAMSRKPSPLKSATTTDLGLFPTANGEPGASVKSPVGLQLASPSPSSTDILFEVEFTRTTSGGWEVGHLVLVLRKTPVAMATCPVSLAPRVIGDGVS